MIEVKARIAGFTFLENALLADPIRFLCLHISRHGPDLYWCERNRIGIRLDSSWIWTVPRLESSELWMVSNERRSIKNSKTLRGNLTREKLILKKSKLARCEHNQLSKVQSRFDPSPVESTNLFLIVKLCETVVRSQCLVHSRSMPVVLFVS